jgi:hypothetical protein
MYVITTKLLRQYTLNGQMYKNYGVLTIMWTTTHFVMRSCYEDVSLEDGQFMTEICRLKLERIKVIYVLHKCVGITYISGIRINARYETLDLLVSFWLIEQFRSSSARNCCFCCSEVCSSLC